MRLRFQTCGLCCDLEYPSAFAEAVQHLLKSYVFCNRGMKPTLKLKIQRATATAGRSGVVPVDLPDEHAGHLRLDALSAHALTVALAEGSPWEISAALGLGLSRAFMLHGGLLLHAALLLEERGAHLLLGPSGAGKSTAARLAPAMRCLHDDKAAIRKRQGRWLAYGTPLLDNGGQPGLNGSAPLLSLNLVSQARESGLCRLAAGEAVLAELAQNLIVPPLAAGAGLLQTFLDAALEIPVFRLDFSKRSRVGDLLRAGI